MGFLIPVPLYPFGVENGDEKLSEVDDACSATISVATGLPINDRLHTKLYVSYIIQI